MRPFLLLPLALAACQAPLSTTPRASETPAPDTRVVLQEGESRLLGDDYTMSIVRIDDSRCPIGVECVWAGEARVAVGPSHPTMRFRPDTLTLGAPRPGQRDSMRIGPFRVRLVAVDPVPRASTPPDAAKTATFDIRR